MSLEQFKTQILLLHSEQSTLDTLSTGFDDRYSVHFATSGSEALNTLTETPIHVIVTAQDLPGMSGLDALREAKKRSPDTIGILLAGTDKQDGLEALVGDQEVFKIVRGEISPEALLELVQSSDKRMRMSTLSQSANDLRANVDEPVSEHIVMETSENGSAIISDGTGTVPLLKPSKVDLAPGIGGREVDVLVLTTDEEFLTTVKDSSRGLHNVHHAISPMQAEKIVRDHTVGVLLTDAAMVGSKVEALTQRLRIDRPRIVAIVAGRRNDGELLMDLINRGHVYRFLLKPVSPGRARLAIEASVKHHMEAPDDAFKPKSERSPVSQKPAAKPLPKAAAKPLPKAAAKPLPKAAAKPLPKAAAKPLPKAAAKPLPKATAKPLSKAAAKPLSKAAAKPLSKAAAKPLSKAAAKPLSKAAAKPKPAPAPVAPKTEKPAPPEQPKPERRSAEKIEPTISDAPIEVTIDTDLDGAFVETSSFTATMTDVAASVGKSIAGAGASVASNAQELLGSVDDLASRFKSQKTIAIGGGAIVALAAVAWFVMGGNSAPEQIVPEQAASTAASVSETGIDVAAPASLPVAAAPIESAATDASEPLALPYAAQLEQARAARDAGNLIAPAGANAIELFVAITALAGEDSVIATELEAVVNQVLGVTENAILARNASEAEAALNMARFADPDNLRLAFLGAQINQMNLQDTADQARLAISEGRFGDAVGLISQAQSLAAGSSADVDLLNEELAAARIQLQVVETIATANTRLESGNLISPQNDSAQHYFSLALNSDPDNQIARQGLNAIAGLLAVRARDAILEGRLDDAEELLRESRALDPANTELTASAAALQQARDAAAEAVRQAEADRLVELERQREAERQLTIARQAEIDRQAEVERQAAIARQAEIDRQAEVERQAAIGRQAEIDRQAEVERRAAIVAQTELRQRETDAILQEQRKAEAAVNARIDAEQQANRTATASSLGVGAVAPTRSAPSSGNIAKPAVTPPVEVPASAGATTFGVPETINSITERRVQQPSQTVARFEPAQVPSQLPQQRNIVAETPAASAAGTTANLPTETEMVPMSRLTRTNYVGPVFPRAASRRNVEGSVDIMFTVTTDGRVRDIVISRSNPGTTFNQAATDAVEQWRFEPVLENGMAVEKRTAVRLAFSLQ